MAELKTKPTDQSVVEFINSIQDEVKRKDCFTLVEIFREITGAEPKMWGGAIIGFVDIHLKYASGRELDWFKTGFSPRKQNISLYVGMYHNEEQAELVKTLGKHKAGKGCVYINKLSDVDVNVLKEIIKNSSFG